MYCSNLPDKLWTCQVVVQVIIICSIWSRLCFIQRWSFRNYGLLKWAGGLRKRTVHVLISFSFQMVIVNVCCFKLINWEIIMSNILMNFRIKYSNHVGEIPVLWWGWLENSFYWSHDHDIYTLILSGLFSIALKKLSGKAREIDGIVPYIRNHWYSFGWSVMILMTNVSWFVVIFMSDI